MKVEVHIWHRRLMVMMFCDVMQYGMKILMIVACLCARKCLFSMLASLPSCWKISYSFISFGNIRLVIA